MNVRRDAAQNSVHRIGTVSRGRRIDADSSSWRMPRRKNIDARLATGLTGRLVFDPPLGAGYQTRRALL
jgi:hypothetical protein